MGITEGGPMRSTTGVQHVVRLSDPDAVEDLVEMLLRTQTEVRRRGSRTVVVGCGDDVDETELLFFLKAWALSHRNLEFELSRL
jgi:hypothetical protein